MNDFEKASRYLPVFMQDLNEPFEIAHIAYHIHNNDGKSISSRFNVELNGAAYAIEYPIFWDYDIQHLYDLEHAFVYVAEDGSVTDVISSFHGKFYRQSSKFTDDTHPLLYIQPGKHALMADPEYFKLFVDFYGACKQKAGADGVLAPDFLTGIPQNTDIDSKVEHYIKENFSFAPAERYESRIFPADKLITWEELASLIPGIVNRELKKIGAL